MRAHLRLWSGIDLGRHIKEASIVSHDCWVRDETAWKGLRVRDHWLMGADLLLWWRSIRIRLLHNLWHDLKLRLLLLLLWIVGLCSCHARGLWLHELRCTEVLKHLARVAD
jgi:hypothetical protein